MPPPAFRTAITLVAAGALLSQKMTPEPRADNRIMPESRIRDDGGKHAPHVREEQAASGEVGGPSQLGHAAGVETLGGIFRVPHE